MRSPVAAALAVLVLSAAPFARGEDAPVDKDASLPSHRSERYLVRSELGAEACREVALHLERAHRAYAKLLPYERKAAPSYPWKVRLFDTREAFLKHPSARGFRSFFYVRPANEVVGYAIAKPRLESRLAHEGFHQYFRSFIEEPPEWINEGLGEHVEAATIDEDGKLDTSLRIDRGWTRTWREAIRDLDKAIPGGGRATPIPLAELLTMSKAAFRKKQTVAYCESWGLVRFALSDPELSKTLLAYLNALDPAANQAANTEAAFKAAFGSTDLAELEGRFFGYMDSLVPPGHEAFVKGCEQLAAKHSRDAAASFTAAIARDPTACTYFYYRAKAESRMQAREQDWKADALRATELDPEDGPAHLLLAKAQLALDELDAARASAERARTFGRSLDDDVKKLSEKIDARAAEKAEKK